MMRRRCRLLWLLLLAALALGAGSAQAGYCSNCGTDQPSGYRYCYHCGAAVIGPGTSATATPAPDMTIDAPRLLSDGKVYLTWNDPAGNAPYSTSYMRMKHNTFNDELDGVYFYWNNGEGLPDAADVLDSLVPGVPYWLVVEDAAGSRYEYAYRPAPAPWWQHFGTEMSIAVKSVSRGTETDLQGISASEYAWYEATTDYNLSLRLELSRVGDVKPERGLLAIEDPRGEAIAVGTIGTDFSAGNPSYSWTFDLDWYLETISKKYGELPQGVYTITLYYDSSAAGQSTLRVMQ